MSAHRIRWYGRAGDEWIPRNGMMRGKDWGWDVKCSCGWQTRTGGAIQERIREEIAAHRSDAPRPIWCRTCLEVGSAVEAVTELHGVPVCEWHLYLTNNPRRRS